MTAKSSRPVSSSQHQLAPISRRGKAKVLSTAFRALQTGPISSPTSSPYRTPCRLLEPHWSPRTNQACSCLRAFAQAVPSVYTGPPPPRLPLLCIACFNLLQSLLKRYIFSEAFSALFISNYTPSHYSPTPFFLFFLVTTTLYHILGFIYFVLLFVFLSRNMSSGGQDYLFCLWLTSRPPKSPWHSFSCSLY